MKKERDYINIAAVLSIIGAVLAILAFLCYMKFSTYNFPKVTYALFAVSAGDKEYIVAQDQPRRVVIASPEQPEKIFRTYLKKHGYRIQEKERMGSRWTVIRNGRKETVSFQTNTYFSKWIWD